MIRTRTRTLPFAVAAALLLALPVVGHAQDADEEESRFSWNAALTSDYVFRGVSQTDEGVAIQGGLDFDLGGGFYVGAWGSNVDYGSFGPEIEIDTYVGWNHDLSDDWNLDLMVNRYNYLGEEDGFGDGDYVEFFGAIAYGEMLTFTVGYTNDVYNLSEDGWYYGAAGSWEIGGGFSLGAGVGLSTFDENTGVEDYTDYNLSISRDFGPMNAALGWYGTDSDGEFNFGELAEDRLVLTLSIGG